VPAGGGWHGRSQYERSKRSDEQDTKRQGNQAEELCEAVGASLLHVPQRRRRKGRRATPPPAFPSAVRGGRRCTMPMSPVLALSMSSWSVPRRRGGSCRCDVGKCGWVMAIASQPAAALSSRWPRGHMHKNATARVRFCGRDVTDLGTRAMLHCSRRAMASSYLRARMRRWRDESNAALFSLWLRPASIDVAGTVYSCCGHCTYGVMSLRGLGLSAAPS